MMMMGRIQIQQLVCWCTLYTVYSYTHIHSRYTRYVYYTQVSNEITPDASTGKHGVCRAIHHHPISFGQRLFTVLLSILSFTILIQILTNRAETIYSKIQRITQYNYSTQFKETYYFSSHLLYTQKKHVYWDNLYWFPYVIKKSYSYSCVSVNSKDQV